MTDASDPTELLTGESRLAVGFRARPLPAWICECISEADRAELEQLVRDVFLMNYLTAIDWFEAALSSKDPAQQSVQRLSHAVHHAAVRLAVAAGDERSALGQLVLADLGGPRPGGRAPRRGRSGAVCSPRKSCWERSSACAGCRETERRALGTSFRRAPLSPDTPAPYGVKACDGEKGTG